MHRHFIPLKVVVVIFLLTGDCYNPPQAFRFFPRYFLSNPAKSPSFTAAARFGSREKLINGIRRCSVTLETPDTYAEGEAYFINPGQVRIAQRVAESMRDRDVITHWAHLGDTEAGMLIEEYVAAEMESPNVLLAFNSHQGHFWEASTLLVINGVLVMKAEGKRGIQQEQYQPLSGPFWVLSFDSDNPGVFRIELKEGKSENPLPVQNGLSGPPLLMNGQSMLEQLRFNRRPALEGNDLGWRAIDHQLAMTCYGYTAGGELVILQLIGNPDDSVRKEPTLFQVVDILEKLGIRDAVLGGTSGDVQRYSVFDNPSVVRSRGRRGSGFQKAFPNGRPLGTAVLILGKPTEDLGESLGEFL